MNLSRFQSGLARWGWLLPLLALVLLLGITAYLGRLNDEQLEAARRDAAAAAEQEAATLAENIGAEVATRIGALAAAKLQYTSYEDSLPQRTLIAVDSVASELSGLTGISIIDSAGRLHASATALLDRAGDPLARPDLAEAYRKAVETRSATATGVINLLGGRRFIVFDPIARSDTTPVEAVLAAEVQPLTILSAALEHERPLVRPSLYDIYDPAGTRITTVPAPQGWPTVERTIRVADTNWRLVLAHQPVNVTSFQVVGAAIRVSGIVIALAFSLSLLLLWRTVAAQQQEIAARRAAEQQATESGAEAARRAEQARQLTEQLEWAQQAALRLSGSLDPDQVIDEFLGAVAEALDADVALLYTFDENGEVVVGRRRIILNRELAATDRNLHEDFRKVRVPAALMPHLAEPAATGEPFLVTGDDATLTPPGAGAGAAPRSALLTVPLGIGGHLVGLAVWESYGEAHQFHAGRVPFARALSAHAAANLRAAELLEGVRQARQNARKEAVRLATVLEQLSDGVVLFGREGHPERVNPAAEALLGPELSKTPLARWTTAFQIRQPGGGSYPGQFPPVRALEGVPVRNTRFTVRYRGTDRYIAASAAPIRGPEGSVRGAALVLRDVTDEHEYAEMLRHTNQELRQQATLLERANDEMRAATAAKDQFLAMMSHELRTPINAIIGYSDLLDIGVHGTLNEKQLQMLNRITETSRHLLGLITDVLDLTKIGAGRIDLNLQPTPLRPVVRRAMDQVTPLAESKGLRIEMQGDEQICVVADDTRLLQILINLASNSVKFTEEGGITLRYESDEDHALIHVRDTGPGIAEAERERIFEEFYQVDAGLARRSGGSGLGLAISLRLARLMGGDLMLDSEPGVGTEFTLKLPLAEGEATEPDPAQAEESRR